MKFFFTSKEFEDFLIEFDVNHIKIATGSHQANGQIVRVNRSLAKLLESEKCILGHSAVLCII